MNTEKWTGSFSRERKNKTNRKIDSKQRFCKTYIFHFKKSSEWKKLIMKKNHFYHSTNKINNAFPIKILPIFFYYYIYILNELFFFFDYGIVCQVKTQFCSFAISVQDCILVVKKNRQYLFSKFAKLLKASSSRWRISLQFG